MSLVAVKLRERYGIYNSGEAAGFDPAVARHLVEVLQIAEYLTPPKAPTEEEIQSEQVLPEQMDDAQLRALAREHNIKVPPRMKSEGIIELLRSAGVLPEV